MKKYRLITVMVILAAISAGWAISCTKKPQPPIHIHDKDTAVATDTCIRHFFYLRPILVSFKGFTLAELNPVITTNYKRTPSGNVLVSEDSNIYTPNDLFIFGDTILPKNGPGGYNSFVYIESGHDYRIFLPNANKVYEITGSEDGPPYDTFYVRGGHCPLGTQGPWVFNPVHTLINGKSVPNYPISRVDQVNKYFIFTK